MLFGLTKYNIDDFKKQYAKADKEFNVKKVNSTDKEPSGEIFKSRSWKRLTKINSKAINSIKNSKNAEYYKVIESTNGDYSRRKDGVGEQAKAMRDWVKDKINSNPNLKYSMCGVFVDTYENLCNMKWRQAYKIAFDYCKKLGSEKTLLSSICLQYFSQVFALETMMMRLVEFQILVASGVEETEAIVKVHLNDKQFVDKVVFGSINVNAMISTNDNPVKMVRNYISGEQNQDRSKESYEFDPSVQSTESVLGGLKKWLTEDFGSAVFQGVVGVAAVLTGIATGGAVAGIVATIVLSIVFLAASVPNIRLIIYYSYAADVDTLKELKLYKEMLENNIAILQEKYDKMKEGPEKEKLKSVIEKQKKYFEDLQYKIDKLSDNDVENAMSKDESVATDESISEDGSDDDDTDYTIEI